VREYGGTRSASTRYVLGPKAALRGIAGLIGGLLLFDLLINLPGWSPAAPVSSLLAPSVDLLLVAAALLGAATAGRGPRIFIRIAVCLLLVFLLGYATGTRFGFDLAFRLLGRGSAVLFLAGCLLSTAAVAAAAGLAWLFSLLVTRGFSHLVTRSVFLAVVALLTILQVVSGKHIFTPSEIPRLARNIGLF
jgi:hypothetical protein